MKRFWCYIRVKTKLLKRTLWSSPLAIAKVVWVALPVLFLTGGTFFAYAGWVLDHPDRHGWLAGLIGAAEAQLLKSYDVLRSGGKILASAPGFDHIVRVLFQESEVRYQLEKRFLSGEPMNYEAFGRVQ